MICTKARRRIAGLVITIALAVAVFILAPQQIGVAISKLSLVTLGGLVGFWLDRIIFPYAEPDDLLNRYKSAKFESDEIRDALLESFDRAMLRRSIIMAAAVIGVCLGL